MQRAYDWEEDYWENKPSIKTALNKTNMDKLSNATRIIDERVITLDLTKLSKIDANGMITGIAINQDNGDITVTYYSGATRVLHTLLAQISINFDYDKNTEQLIIFLQDGSKKYVDLSALITQFEFLDSDTIYWTIDKDGKVKADIKKGSITADKLQPDYLADITVQAETAKQQIKTAFENLLSRSPLIHNITNYVTVNDCANMVLACGASPIMADDAAEVEEITAICGGLNINIGTLNSRTVTSMLLAGKKANQLGHPVVLDPVGAGASHLRTDTAFRLLREVQLTVIRGNISEIKTLASGAGTTKGVDADVADKVTEENLDSAVAFAKAFAARTGAVVAITGAIDIVADAQKAYCIRNGNAMMSSITGTGCQLSALTAAFVTANPDHPLEAAAAAVCAMGLAGEVAHQRLTPQDGNATYRNYIIDAIYNMTPEQLEKGANYEVR